jgi:uroporphyrinogen decarboxylase
MTGAQKPILAALNGEAVWPPPFWLMRQAGRYLPEYRAVRGRAGDFISLCTNPALAAEVTLQPLHRYGMDAAILFSDILMVPWALGQGLRFAEGEGPLLDRLEGEADLARLDLEGLPARAAPIFETVARVRAGLEENHPKATLIGFAGSPFTVACYMVDGRGGGEFPLTRRLAHGDPAYFARLMRLLVDATTSYLLAQVQAGAEALMLFDSWAGLLPPAQFRRWVIEPTAQLVRNLRKSLPEGFPLIGFPRLAGPMLQEYAQRVGVEAVGMDTSMDPRWAAAHIPAGVALQGNLDPQALVAGGTALEVEARAIMAAMRGVPFIFNLGHGIVPPTPVEHVAALTRVLRAG